MSVHQSRPPRPRARRPDGTAPHGRGRLPGHTKHEGEGEPTDLHRPIVLRCPGPLVALRGLAALYRVSARQLAALLPAGETRARAEGGHAAGALRRALSDALGAPPLTPAAVHYFHAAWLREPQLVLKQGLHPGARGSLVCDVLLRPGLYGAYDHLELPELVEDLGAVHSPIAGLDLADRCCRATTPCIVEYRRHPAPNHQDVDAALWFVAAALRGGVSRAGVGGHEAHGTPIAAHDIVSVRAVSTQTEWTHQHPSR